MITCRSTVPLVKKMASEVNAQGITIRALSERSGVSTTALERWFMKGTMPTLENARACFNVLGLDLVVEKRNV